MERAGGGTSRWPAWPAHCYTRCERRRPAGSHTTQGAIALALQTASNRPADTLAAFRRRARDRFLLVAFAHTGARLNEIVGASMGSIYTEGNGRWWLDVNAKGNKPRRLPVPPDMLEAFRDYRQTFELLPQSSRTDRKPVVLSSRSRELARITDEAASEAIKAVFADAARAADAQGTATRRRRCARPRRTGCTTAC